METEPKQPELPADVKAQLEELAQLKSALPPLQAAAQEAPKLKSALEQQAAELAKVKSDHEATTGELTKIKTALAVKEAEALNSRRSAVQTKFEMTADEAKALTADQISVLEKIKPKAPAPTRNGFDAEGHGGGNTSNLSSRDRIAASLNNKG